MAVAPDNLVATHLFKRKVLNREQATLLQVWRSNTPTSFEVAIQAIAKHVAQSALGLGKRLVFHAGITGIQLKRQIQRIKYLLRQLLVMDSFRTSLLCGSIDG